MNRPAAPTRARTPLRRSLAGRTGAACVALAMAAPLARGQELDRSSVSGPAASQRVVVTGEGVASAYGAPASFSRSRFANLTNAYVLPPFAVYAGLIYEGNALRYDHPDHLFTQEIELGLPYRFGVAIENGQEAYRNRGQETTLSFELRYALADWNKIPLNPTFFVEYRKGFGHIFHDEGVPMRRDRGGGEEDDMGEEDLRAAAARHHHRRAKAEDDGGDDEGGDDEGEEEGGKRPRIPDAVEFRLLLAYDYHEKVEWAANFFFELEVQGDRGREWGFAQSVLTPVLSRERLKLGLEMQYSNFTDKDTRGDQAQRFVIGPTVAFKPTRNTRFDLSPLFGATFDAPRVQAFAVFSYTFGPGGEGKEAEAPASTRNR